MAGLAERTGEPWQPWLPGPSGAKPSLLEMSSTRPIIIVAMVMIMRTIYQCRNTPILGRITVPARTSYHPVLRRQVGP